jgi:hypothetical protein
MQPDYKYKTYKPKSTGQATYNYKPQTFTTTPMTSEEKTKASLQSQKENLKKRLEAVGVSPDELSESAIDNRSIMEKALNLKNDQGMLMDLFEIINRPVQMTKGLISGLAEGQDPFKAAWDGLAGNAEISSAELLQDLGVIEDPEQLGGFGKFAVNVAGDILLDPLTYFGGPIAWMKKGGLLGKKQVAEEIVNSTLKEATKLGGKFNTIDDLFKRADELKNLVPTNELDTFIKKSVLFEDDLLKAYNLVDGQTGNLMDASKNLKGASGTKVRLEKKAVKEASKAAPGQAFESQAISGTFKLINKKLGELADNLFVAAEVANNKLDDLYFFYRKGDKYLKSAIKMDVKGLIPTTPKGALSKGWANLMSPSIGFKDGEVFIKPEFFKNYSKQTAEALDKSMQDLYVILGKENSDKFVNILKGLQKTPGKRAVAGRGKGITDKFLPEEIALLDDGLRKLFKAKYADEFIFVPYADDLKIFKAESLADQLDFKSYFQAPSGKKITKTTQESLRFMSELKPTQGFDITSALDDSEELISQLFNTERKSGVIGRLINAAAASDYAILSAPANIWKQAESAVKYAFNYTAGLPRELIGKIKGIQGKAGQRMMNYSRKLAQIQKKMATTNPEAGRILTNISEFANIDEAGNLIARSRDYAFSDILDSMTTQLANGGDIILPATIDDITKKNFLGALNKLDRRYKDVVGPLNARIIKSSENGMKISVDLTVKELKELMQAIDPVDAQSLIKFGRKEITDEMKELFTKHGDEIKQFLKLKDDVTGVLINELGFQNLPDEMKGTLGYLRHSLSDAAKKRLKSTAPITKRQFISGGTDVLKQRNYLGSIDETNAAMREFMGLDYDLLDADAFNSMEDLIRITAAKEEQGNLVKALLDGTNQNGDSLFKKLPNQQQALETLGPDFKVFEATGNFKDEFSKLYKNLSPEAQSAVSEFFEGFGAETAEVFAMHKSAYNILKSVERAYVEMPKAIKMFDKFMNAWKGITLVSPGFHMRNLFGNMTNSYLVGMGFTDQARYSTKAFKDFNVFKRFRNTVAESGLDAIPDDVQREAYLRVLDYFESGVAQTHKGIRDLEGVKQALKVKPGAKGYQKLLEANFNLAEHSDDIQRYMLYQWGMDSSKKAIEKEMVGSSAEAIANRIRNTGSEKVSEALFDYSHLTSFEKEYMKRLFPFYTFMKSNLVFQSKNLFYRTGRYASLGRAYDYWNEDMAGISTDEMPDYMQDNMWLPLPMLVSKDDKEAIAFLKLNLPVSDFTELVEQPFAKGIQSLSVPFKMIIELGMGRDTFTSQQLEKYPGEANRMAEGEGALSFIRAKDGTLALSSNPLIQKLADDLGLRVPKNYASIALDLIDSASGYQSASSAATDVFSRLSLIGATDRDRIELTGLYQELERLRNLRSLYEQEENAKLPTLEELGLKN